MSNTETIVLGGGCFWCTETPISFAINNLAAFLGLLGTFLAK